MKNSVKARLMKRIKEIDSLNDEERSALLGLLLSRKRIIRASHGLSDYIARHQSKGQGELHINVLG
ncbi:MAG: hypothetical protein LUC22_06095, partial [Prevotella sp.]|nr:hypothetical protein [Prevotella sp.]